MKHKSSDDNASILSCHSSHADLCKNHASNVENVCIHEYEGNQVMGIPYEQLPCPQGSSLANIFDETKELGTLNAT